MNKLSGDGAEAFVRSQGQEIVSHGVGVAPQVARLSVVQPGEAAAAEFNLEVLPSRD